MHKNITIYIYIYIFRTFRSHIHAGIEMKIQTYAHTYVHKHVHMYIHTYTYTHMYAHAQKRVGEHLPSEVLQARTAWEGLVVMNTQKMAQDTQACLKEAAEARAREVDGKRRVVIVAREGAGIQRAHADTRHGDDSGDAGDDAAHVRVDVNRMRAESLKDVKDAMRGKLGAYKRIHTTGACIA